MSAASRLATTRASATATFGSALLFAAALLSALAPLGRGLAQARLGGRAAFFFICFAPGSSSQPDAYPGRPDPKHDRGLACALCAAFCSGDAPLGAQSGFFGATPVQSFTQAWMVADRVAPTLRRSLSHRARAPRRPSGELHSAGLRRRRTSPCGAAAGLSPRPLVNRCGVCHVE